MIEEQVVEELEAEGNAPAPVQGIDVINRVIRALFIHKKEASYKDLSGPAALNPAIASQALSSSRDLGLTKSAGKKGLYLLSPRGVEYARFLTQNRMDECQNVLKQILLENPLWKDIVTFLRTSEGDQRDPIDLVMSTVENKLGKQWSPRMRRQVSDSIVSALEYARMVERESGRITSIIGPSDNTDLGTRANQRIQPVSSVSGGPKISSQPLTGFYELAGDGFYMKIRRDPATIAEAYDHLHLIMKRNTQQPVSDRAELNEEIPRGSDD